MGIARTIWSRSGHNLLRNSRNAVAVRVRRQPLGLKSEEKPDEVVREVEDQPAVIKDTVVLVVVMRRVPLIHMDIVHPVSGAELGVDPWLRSRVVEVGTEREQFPTGDLEVLQLSAHHVLQVVVLTWTGRWERDPVRPVEEWGAGIVEGVRGRARLLVQVGEPGRQERQPSKDRVAQ